MSSDVISYEAISFSFFHTQSTLEQLLTWLKALMFMYHGIFINTSPYWNDLVDKLLFSSYIRYVFANTLPNKGIMSTLTISYSPKIIISILPISKLV
jgi:hypothetical protein